MIPVLINIELHNVTFITWARKLTLTVAAAVAPTS